MKNSVTEKKIHQRESVADQRMQKNASDLEDRVVENNQVEQQKRKRVIKKETLLRNVAISSSTITFTLQGFPEEGEREREGKEKGGQKAYLKR